MRTNKYKATWLLAVSAAGYITAMPFTHTFAGALAEAAFRAALIGGLADWFTITALFRKPLGIPFKTAVIPRNRTRIIHDIASFVEKDLLTPENLIKQIDRQNLAQTLIGYVSSPQGNAVSKELFCKVFMSLIQQISGERLGKYLEESVVKAGHSGKNSLFALFFSLLRQPETLKRTTGYLLDGFIQMANHPQFLLFMENLIKEVKHEYEQEKERRKLANELLLHMKPSNLAKDAQKALVVWLTQLKQEEHPAHSWLIRWLDELLLEVQNNPSRESCQEDEAKILSWHNLQSMLVLGIENLQQRLQLHQYETVRRWSGELFDYFFLHFIETHEWQQQADCWLKRKAADLLRYAHAYIGELVRKQLEQFSDEFLSEFIEAKAGNDFQMIRVNGSLIGAAAGILLFLFSYALEKVMG